MNALTAKELALVQTSTSAKSLRRLRLTRLGFVMICAGVAVAVAPSIVAWGDGSESWAACRQTIAFFAVMIGFAFVQLENAAYAHVAQSTISKLYRAAHCIQCGASLPSTGGIRGRS